jgi:hypothetical protein
MFWEFTAIHLAGSWWSTSWISGDMLRGERPTSSDTFDGSIEVLANRKRRSRLRERRSAG